ncbi:MAG: hypothetical protein LBV16_06295 [Elusimicrobiota bacterium]|jgi:hypothetical protein|nr:hypothetical protein [Elusimicrobiota bacterium]
MAGTSVIDKYTFNLLMNSKQFQKGVNSANMAVKGMTKVFMAAFAAIGGIAVFKKAVSDYSNLAKSIGRLSETTGESIQDIQGWQISIGGRYMSKCPDCGAKLIHQESCAHYPNCGWSACKNLIICGKICHNTNVSISKSKN